MHDPMTVAFEIRSPFGRRHRMKDGSLSDETDRYHRPLVTIWHHDPEVNGDDDSCGWFHPPTDDADKHWAQGYARKEWVFWFSQKFASINLARSDDAAILTAAWKEVREHERKGGRHEKLRLWEVDELLSLLACPGDNFGHLILAARSDARGMESLLRLTLKHYRRVRRPWWRHPRWHVHHWSLQVHDLQTFNRWAFSRCCFCGKRFRWGYSPMSGWGGSGPRFLRGEKGVYHHECEPNRMAQPEEVTP